MGNTNTGTGEDSLVPKCRRPPGPRTAQASARRTYPPHNCARGREAHAGVSGKCAQVSRCRAHTSENGESAGRGSFGSLGARKKGRRDLRPVLRLNHHVEATSDTPAHELRNARRQRGNESAAQCTHVGATLYHATTHRCKRAAAAINRHRKGGSKYEKNRKRRGRQNVVEVFRGSGEREAERGPRFLMLGLESHWIAPSKVEAEAIKGEVGAERVNLYHWGLQ